MKTKKQKDTIAKRTVLTLYAIFSIGFFPLLWYGIFEHEKYPYATYWLIGYSFFLCAWYGKIGEEILFQWKWKNTMDEPSDNITMKEEKICR